MGIADRLEGCKFISNNFLSVTEPLFIKTNLPDSKVYRLHETEVGTPFIGWLEKAYIPIIHVKRFSG
jgi:hypothetical protein